MPKEHHPKATELAERLGLSENGYTLLDDEQDARMMTAIMTEIPQDSLVNKEAVYTSLMVRFLPSIAKAYKEKVSGDRPKLYNVYTLLLTRSSTFGCFAKFMRVAEEAKDLYKTHVRAMIKGDPITYIKDQQLMITFSTLLGMLVQYAFYYSDNVEPLSPDDTKEIRDIVGAAGHFYYDLLQKDGGTQPGYIREFREVTAQNCFELEQYFAGKLPGDRVLSRVAYRPSWVTCPHDDCHKPSATPKPRSELLACSNCTSVGSLASSQETLLQDGLLI